MDEGETLETLKNKPDWCGGLNVKLKIVTELNERKFDFSIFLLFKCNSLCKILVHRFFFLHIRKINLHNSTQTNEKTKNVFE